MTAIDAADASHLRVFTGQTSPVNHGLSVSNDGDRHYIAKIGMISGAPLDGNGLQIYDVIGVQQRRPTPQIHLVGQSLWEDGAIDQHAIRISYDGVPHLVYVDEGGAGAAASETSPTRASPSGVEAEAGSQHAPQRRPGREGHPWSAWTARRS